MMWPSRQQDKARIAAALAHHAANVRPLPGIADPAALETLATQFIASLRREAYFQVIRQRQPSAQRADPKSPLFDPERAVAYHVSQGNDDEAGWLIFLMTHFAKPEIGGWSRLRDLYGMLGAGIWSWAAVTANPAAFKAWLQANWQRIGGKFGNHRKYESLRPTSRRNMGAVVDSYVAWVQGAGGHRALFAGAVRRAGNDPHKIFDVLYDDLPVLSFGRLAKFDYLSMVGRFGLAPIDAGSAYLDGATGPLAGARLLFDGRTNGRTSTATIQRWLDQLDLSLGVSMKVMEDALCNWQKSPTRFIHFKG
jgi:hypothetical protein